MGVEGKVRETLVSVSPVQQVRVLAFEITVFLSPQEDQVKLKELRILVKSVGCKALS